MNTDGLIWFGGITLMLIFWAGWKVLERRRTVRANARRRAMRRHPSAQAPRPDAADYALRLWTERGK